MGKIDEIAKGIDFADPKAVARAADRMSSVTDLEINLALLHARGTGTINDTTKSVIALARLARDQRDAQERLRLARKTTLWSGLTAILGAVVGACLTYLFGNFGS